MTSTRQMTKRALIVGLIGYASVVAFYMIVDVFSGRGLLYTGNVLAKAFFRKLYDPDVLSMPIPIDPEAVLWHNMMHLLVAITIGFIIIGLVEDAIRNPAKSRFILITFFLGFVVTVGTMAILTDAIRHHLPFWSIAFSNLVSAAIAGAFIVRWYPGLWDVLFASSDRLEAQPNPARPDED